MKKVTIIGLGWLGMPLAMALTACGWQVKGSKTTPDCIEAARMCGVESYPLILTPELICDTEELEALLTVDALVVNLPARHTAEGGENYVLAVQNLVDSALAFHVPHIVFVSSTSVYGNYPGIMREESPRRPESTAGKSLLKLENWLHDLPGTSVDILRLAGLAGPGRHPGRFLAGEINVPYGDHGVNLVHLDDVVAAIILLLQTLPGTGRHYNLCAPRHPARHQFYPEMAKRLGLVPPVFAAGDGSNGKIIDGSRICCELGFAYRYPDPMKMPVS